MKVRVPKKLDIFNDTFQLTRKDIEAQVLSDLGKYRNLYQKKYGKSPSSVLDVDNFIQVMWGVNVVFEEIEQCDKNHDTLGYFDPENNTVYVDSLCTNQKRVSFTIAHEAGHLSLHQYMFQRGDDGLISGWRKRETNKDHKKGQANIRREWQANVYAGALLAPAIEVTSFIKELGVSVLLGESIDLNVHFESFENKFGLSRQALEIRLREIGISTLNNRYSVS